jgi:exodeoxyribonuclease VII large subunit
MAVRGEISNFTRASSGHLYLTLKDPQAQVRAVMFRGRAQYLGFSPREGQQVVAKVLAGLYEPRGDFQLTIEAMRLAGAGDLHEQFLRLKAKLQAEGLFEASLKRAIPAVVRRIGVITSPQAAALRDVLATLRARAPHIEVVLYPSLVQGLEAPGGLRNALQLASDRHEVDVLLIVRGGGSIEDLWAFNDETLARMVRDTPFPVISGVGHETDFTILDFVADLRAPTPTAAAAAASPDRREWIATLSAIARELARNVRRQLSQSDQTLDYLARRLRPPSAHWALREQALGSLTRRLMAAWASGLSGTERRVAAAQARLRGPDLARSALRLHEAAQRMLRLQALERLQDRVAGLAHRLEQASPQQTLARGYAIVLDQSGQVVKSDAELAHGQRLDLRLAKGQAEVEVVRTVQSRG